MMEGGIGSRQEGEDAAGGLGKPDQFPQKATEAASGEGASGEGEPLEDDTSEVCRESGDGSQGGVNALADKGGAGAGVELGFGADEEAGGLE